VSRAVPGPARAGSRRTRRDGLFPAVCADLHKYECTEGRVEPGVVAVEDRGHSVEGRALRNGMAVLGSSRYTTLLLPSRVEVAGGRPEVDPLDRDADGQAGDLLRAQLVWLVGAEPQQSVRGDDGVEDAAVAAVIPALAVASGHRERCGRGRRARRARRRAVENVRGSFDPPSRGACRGGLRTQAGQGFNSFRCSGRYSGPRLEPP
jgi:hypothetical protein